jgi:hypothetical protein
MFFPFLVRTDFHNRSISGGVGQGRLRHEVVHGEPKATNGLRGRNTYKSASGVSEATLMLRRTRAITAVSVSTGTAAGALACPGWSHPPAGGRRRRKGSKFDEARSHGDLCWLISMPLASRCDGHHTNALFASAGPGNSRGCSQHETVWTDDLPMQHLIARGRSRARLANPRCPSWVKNGRSRSEQMCVGLTPRRTSISD